MKGKSFICSVLQALSVLVIMFLLILLNANVIVMICGIFLCGVFWLLFDKLERKGVFRNLDEKISQTAIFQFGSRFRKIIYFLLFVLLLFLYMSLF